MPTYVSLVKSAAQHSAKDRDDILHLVAPPTRDVSQTNAPGCTAVPLCRAAQDGDKRTGSQPP